mmetsp:Transcript_87742/g.226126  ORF Transcript_87742/g.226126 Transcript_87742/m.226126 type:complete len:260 (-) Transcript_87742:296-1075(-)
MPRSLAQRLTSRIRALARGSMCPHSVSRAALYRGVVLLTEKSMGMDSLWMPSEAGTSSVTFGSWPRNAERRNLKLPLETRRSVQARMADFCSFCMSSLDGPAALLRPCRRAARTCGVALTTMSTSGTATPKAVPRRRSPLAKPVTSISGTMLRKFCFTKSASCRTTLSPSAVGAICFTSSSTCASQALARRRSGATGWELGWRNSVLEAGADGGTCCCCCCCGLVAAGPADARRGADESAALLLDASLRGGADIPWISA